MGEVGLEGNEVKSKRAEEFFLVGRHSRYCLSLLLAFSVKSFSYKWILGSVLQSANAIKLKVLEPCFSRITSNHTEILSH